ncbi:MAG: acyltransferase family protein [Actinobacteria bacterium]|nr:acyltransferase family protein [Actinomycetota bacterium]
MSLITSGLNAAARGALASATWTRMSIDDWVHLRRTLDGNDIDAWDPAYIRRILPVWRAVVGTYFRAEVRGLDNIPEEGPSLLVGNHSGGTLIADTFVFAGEFYAHFGPARRFHQLAHDIAARLPGTGLRKWGTVAASHENAQRAFDRDAPVLVYPGGDYETFRPSWHSDQIEFGGRKGFVKLALERGVPIVPVVAIGGQETALFLTRGQRAAKATGWASLTRIKVLPVALAPPFGITLLDLPLRFPLPAKITIEVLPPIDIKDRFGPRPDLEEVYEGVTSDMQETLSDLQAERSVPVVG